MSTRRNAWGARACGFSERVAVYPSVYLFFTPIPETPAIAAKIFEISENVWGYDIDTLSARKKLR